MIDASTIAQMQTSGLKSQDTEPMAPPPGWNQQKAEVKEEPKTEISATDTPPAETIQQEDVPATTLADLQNLASQANQVQEVTKEEVESIVNKDEHESRTAEIISEKPAEITKEDRQQIQNELYDLVAEYEKQTSTSNEAEIKARQAAENASAKVLMESIKKRAAEEPKDDEEAKILAGLKASAQAAAKQTISVFHTEDPAPVEELPEKPSRKTKSAKVSLNQQDRTRLNPIGVADKGGKFISSRADFGLADRARPMRVQGISSRSLATVLNVFFNKHRLDDHIRFAGAYLYNSKATGIWDEGGATTDEGSVVIATDPEGHALVPAQVLYKKDSVNGRHARLPIWPKCYVILGGHRRNESLIAIYRLTKIIPPVEANPRYPFYLLKLVGYKSCDDALVLQDDEKDSFWANERHPALLAAERRIYETYATTPGYVSDYREFSMDNDTIADMNDALADPDFIKCIKEEPDLSTSYAKAAVILGNRISELSPDECAQLIVYPVCYPECVTVWLLGIVYNRATKTSKGKRLIYDKVVLQEDSAEQFFYPDRESTECVPYDRMVQTLKAHGGSMLNPFRRVTEYNPIDLEDYYVS